MDGKNRDNESIYVHLARETVELFAREGRRYAPGGTLPAELTAKRAGVFVSIHRENGDLRGCIGTIAPVRANVAEEIIANAIAASTEDPRFPRVNEAELPDLVYNVDVLQPPENIAGAEELDPKKYGVIVSLEGRRGLLLPDLEGVDTVDEQLSIAMSKAGIRQSERGRVKLQRFLVTRCF
ncbi:MAG: AmmeMemoRadiSam system protein A [Spirochaetaceae bacterium]|jgi:AmmeMemoRadiSam system protein A|nr:AmmeMemoRadiSam system protein A [Spirochaetaceae bacterium]